jgi:hypothetical protein
MKRIIAAVSFVAFAAPVFAADVSAPSNQNQDNERAASGSTFATGVWAQDYNFIAPAK